MSIKRNILDSLKFSRKMLEGLIESMNSPADWMHQVHPKANHPLWVVGHIGLADNNFITKFDESKADKPDGCATVFHLISRRCSLWAIYHRTPRHWKRTNDEAKGAIRKLN